MIFYDNGKGKEMKVRSSYVSNSSSSSYVIEYDNFSLGGEGDKEALFVINWLEFEHLLRSSKQENTEILAEGKEQVIAKLIDDDSYRKDGISEYTKEQIEAIKNSDKEFFMSFKVDYNDWMFYRVLTYLVKMGEVNVIESCEC